MIIPQSSLRRWLTTLLRKEAYEAIANFSDINIEFDMRGSERSPNRCAAFAFGTMKDERWCFEQTPRQLWSSPENFLSGFGYAVVETPKHGDVLAYRHRPDDNVQHWGVQRGSKVWSKFYAGPVYSHPIEDVPDIWGSHVTVFRKQGVYAAGK